VLEELKVETNERAIAVRLREPSTLVAQLEQRKLQRSGPQILLSTDLSKGAHAVPWHCCTPESFWSFWEGKVEIK
jgi:hypothetical protein